MVAGTVERLKFSFCNLRKGNTWRNRRDAGFFYFWESWDKVKEPSGSFFLRKCTIQYFLKDSERLLTKKSESSILSWPRRCSGSVEVFRFCTTRDMMLLK